MKAANQILKEYWDKTLPVDPVSIANKLKIMVSSDPVGLGETSGEYDPTGTPQTGPLIRYNPNDPRVRQRFTVAHELGHYVLGHGLSHRDTSGNFTMSPRLNAEERNANQFAAALLMPEGTVKALIEVRGMTSLRELASIFNVSKAAMTFRVKDLGYSVE